MKKLWVNMKHVALAVFTFGLGGFFAIVATGVALTPRLQPHDSSGWLELVAMLAVSGILLWAGVLQLRMLD